MPNRNLLKKSFLSFRCLANGVHFETSLVFFGHLSAQKSPELKISGLQVYSIS